MLPLVVSPHILHNLRALTTQVQEEHRFGERAPEDPTTSHPGRGLTVSCRRCGCGFPVVGGTERLRDAGERHVDAKLGIYMFVCLAMLFRSHDLL